jgi:hypothetical protein
LTSILKQDGGVIGLCKRIVDDGADRVIEGGAISETELTSLLTKHAREQFADLPADTAFAKLYEADPLVRKACRVARDSAWGHGSSFSR